jgi:hypothetical protein
MRFTARKLVPLKAVVKRVVVFDRPVKPRQGFDRVTCLADDKTKAGAISIDGPLTLRKIGHGYH